MWLASRYMQCYIIFLFLEQPQRLGECNWNTLFFTDERKVILTLKPLYIKTKTCEKT